ncbi:MULTISPECIES: hypothetical protein [unclassified Mycobacterium]|uniref:hypothetical protein n=1 Tax=unclassified Mycobacterium TaxID=2642494 RepID=UPI00073FB155|nr:MULTISPECIES: hypothetical protein [unclassified Mycobacterium]KUH85314.1 hypothetical protein AU185_02360 [Mycobacterium sp. GA-0227b]KUH87096.1 hypothetical protein AU186_00110 [Mycobacterium sp. GA-1999]
MDTENPSGAENTNDQPDSTDDAEDTFPRHVVTDLRKEAAGYRDRAKTAETCADDYARRLHTALVQQDGRLADARDLPFRPEHLEDPETLRAAITALLEDRPTLASRTPRGDVGQGARGNHVVPTDFSSLFR